MSFSMKRSLAVGGLALLLVMSAGACDGLGAGDGQSDEERLAELKQTIQEEVGKRAERVEQCRTCAFGSKPCGGPQSYLVYSTASTDEARLKALVKEHNALEAKINREQGRTSECLFVPRPDTTLADGACAAAR